MIKFALIGNQNSGKTTLFNALTGSNAQVGNWPGVTVEKKEGIYHYKNNETGVENLKVTVVDLPGIYSLSPYSPEEIVSRNFLIDEHPDVCINIVDATNLERNLYLTTQVLEIDVPVVVALNMIDAAYKKGIEIDTEKLSKLLGVPVIAISALRNTNIDELMLIAYKASLNRRKGKSVIENDSSLSDLYKKSCEILSKQNSEITSLSYHAVKLLEGDEEEVKFHPDVEKQIKEIREKEPLDIFDGDFQGKVADARYRFITSNIDKIIARKLNDKKLATIEYEDEIRKERTSYQKMLDEKKDKLKKFKKRIKDIKTNKNLNLEIKKSEILKVKKEKEQYLKNINEKLKIQKKYIWKNTSISEKIDSVLTSKIWGIPIFIVIMFLVFHLTFGDDFLYLGAIIQAATGSSENFGTIILDSVAGNEVGQAWLGVLFGSGINCPGTMLQVIVENLTGDVSGVALGLGYAMQGLNAQWQWLDSLILDGLWNGLSMVLSFVPQIMVLFLFITILEDSGYMARAAFIMDRAFRKLGLSGKAFMPLIMCFGCAVPGIYATKSLETERERKVTIMLTPFFSCGAKLEIWLAFAAVLFAGAYGSLIIFGIYLIGIVVAFLVAILLKLTKYKPKASPFLMELPDYHFPRPQSIGVHLWEKLKHYIYKAATIITTSIVVIWILQHLTFNFDYIPDPGTELAATSIYTIEDSILGVLSNYVRYIFYPTGFGDYVVTLSQTGDILHLGGGSASEIAAGAKSVQLGGYFIIACFSGLIAKENVPASLASVSVAAGFSSETGIIDALALDPTVTFSFMVFNLLSIPCMAAVSAAKSELSNNKDFIFALVLWFLIAFICAVFINVYKFSLTILGMLILILGVKYLIEYLRRQKTNEKITS